MSKADTRDKDLDLRPYYDFSGGVRGKYVERFAGSCKVVELEPDVAEVFPDAASVNEILRDVIAARGAKSGSKSAHNHTAAPLTLRVPVAHSSARLSSPNGAPRHGLATNSRRRVVAER